jgi:hypothetical protein
MRNHVADSDKHLLREFRRARAVVKRFGLLKASKKAASYPGRLLKSRITYLQSRHLYPENIIFMASFAKSGSTWLANMLADLPGFSRYQPAGWTASFLDNPNHDIYPGLFEEVGRRLVVIKGHTQGTPENAARLHQEKRKYLLTVRDPRDQMISGYWYLRNHPRHPSHALAMKLDIDEFISHELDPHLAEIRRTEWLRSWIENRDLNLSLLVRYEDLLASTIATLEQILAYFNFDVNEPTIERIVTSNSFTKSSGRPPGAEDPTSFFRRGTAGEWKEIFTADHKAQFSSQMEDLVTALGYEPTMSSSQA